MSGAGAWNTGRSRPSEVPGILAPRPRRDFPLDVFELRKLVEDYGEYATSFVNIADDKVREHVEQELKGGALVAAASDSAEPPYSSRAARSPSSSRAASFTRTASVSSELRA